MLYGILVGAKGACFVVIATWNLKSSFSVVRILCKSLNEKSLNLVQLSISS